MAGGGRCTVSGVRSGSTAPMLSSLSIARGSNAHGYARVERACGCALPRRVRVSAGWGGYGFALLCLPAVLAGVCCCVGLTWWGLRCEGRCEEGVCELL
jgi:hypothetical protein